MPVDPVDPVDDVGADSEVSGVRRDAIATGSAAVPQALVSSNASAKGHVRRRRALRI